MRWRPVAGSFDAKTIVPSSPHVAPRGAAGGGFRLEPALAGLADELNAAGIRAQVTIEPAGTVEPLVDLLVDPVARRADRGDRLAHLHLDLAGEAGNGVGRFARELGVDLILIGSHGHSRLAHILLGSTVERVVRHASCPVLTVRPQSAETAAASPA